MAAVAMTDDGDKETVGTGQPSASQAKAHVKRSFDIQALLQVRGWGSGLHPDCKCQTQGLL
jgi:hypothetical protein